MNSSQEAKLNMYHAVVSHSDANVAIVATVPAFDATMANFKAKVSSIDTTAQLEAQVITGIATDKKFQRETLAQQAADIAAVVFAYAVSVNNNTLKEEVNFSRTELLRLKDDQLVPTCLNIHNAANTNLVALAPYGITAGMLTSFNILMTNYSATVPKPRNAASLRKTYATTLKTLFKESDDMLKKQLDKIAVQFKAANLDFYNTYKNNRIILDPAISNTQVAGTITDSGTDIAVYGVSVTVDGQSYSTTSNLDGSYNLKIPVPGIYTIIFTKAGYTTLQKPNIEIVLGQATALNVELVPVP